MNRRPSIRGVSGSLRAPRDLVPLAALALCPVLTLCLLATSPPRAHAAPSQVSALVPAPGPRPAFCEAEWFTTTGGAHGGAVRENRLDDSGGRRIAEIEDGDWIALGAVPQGGVDSVTVRAASGGIGGTVELRAGSPQGRLLGNLTVPYTGGWDRPASPTARLRGAVGGVRLFAVFTNPAWSAGTADLFALDWFRLDRPATGGG
ncbi:carbohydrate-binding protein [Streptomyces sp. NBC_01013]|uniref:carbohydrate-binding protein n=1 Tax=Streptomyces sp. NBC_01013 TaxID=2903718 RepID=UPI00386F6366|nr:carbohydrate-binding protein [Streptomyces sp. NBC_01013]